MNQGFLLKRESYSTLEFLGPYNKSKLELKSNSVKFFQLIARLKLAIKLAKFRSSSTSAQVRFYNTRGK